MSRRRPAACWGSLGRWGTLGQTRDTGGSPRSPPPAGHRGEQTAGREHATRWHCENYMAGRHASGLGLFLMDYAKPVREIFNTADST